MISNTMGLLTLPALALLVASRVLAQDCSCDPANKLTTAQGTCSFCIEGTTCCADGTWACNSGSGQSTCAEDGVVCETCCDPANLADACCGSSGGFCCADGSWECSPELCDAPGVVCNQASDCSGAVASMGALWPPNHRFQRVSVAGVTDPDGDPVTIAITSLAQDEPTQTVGDGNTCPDAEGLGGPLARLRSERTGTRKVPGDGRVYHVGFTADDGQGGQCQGTVTVCVPHDLGGSPSCVDQGPLYSSTVCTAGLPARESCTGSDLDGDGVCDAEDRCLLVPDPDQGDADADGIGDACDGDFTNDGIVGGPDFVRLLHAYGAREGDPRFDYGLDLGGDGVIGALEYLRLGQGFTQPPGPSGVDCAGLIPCP